MCDVAGEDPDQVSGIICEWIEGGEEEEEEEEEGERLRDCQQAALM